jgi:signal transduction histidine kinase
MPFANPIGRPHAMTSASLLARLLASLGVAVLKRDAAGTFTLLGEPPPWLPRLWPDAARRHTGLRPGDTFLFLAYFLDAAEAVWAAGRGAQQASGPWTEVDPAGKEWPLEAVALCVDGTPLLLLQSPKIDHETYREVLQASREQGLAVHQLQKEIDRREVLLHCIVHDLSNPLAGLKGSLRLLHTDDAADDDARALLAIGLRQVEKMQALIRELLGTFTEQAAQPRRDPAPDVAACAHEVTAALGAAATLASVTLHVEFGAGDTWRVVGEASKLERVLFNLIENALRHAPASTTVVVRLWQEDPFVYCSVTDAGPGVEPALVDRIFDKFAQDSSSGQAGLGLYFCRITVAGWGGQIGYTPAESGGACFWFRLPKPSAD